MLDTTLLASLTWVDWLAIALPALFILMGLVRGGTTVMLSGIIRFLMAWALAGLPAIYITLHQKALIDQIAQQLNVTSAITGLVINAVVFVIAVIVIYRLLGIIWRSLRLVLSSSTIGTIVDRLLGIPLGGFVGVFLSLAIVVVPALQIRAATAQQDQTPGLRNSILMPYAEEQLRELLRYIPSPG